MQPLKGGDDLTERYGKTVKWRVANCYDSIGKMMEICIFQRNSCSVDLTQP